MSLQKTINLINFFFKIVRVIPAFIVIIYLQSCAQKEDSTQALFTLMDSTGINFINTVIDSKQDNSFLFRNFYNGGGVALGDINNDSLPDVLLTSNQGENRLYLNKGHLKFEDITDNSGMHQDSMWSTGATMVDINNDGWLDMYVCNSGHIQDGNRRNKLYINNKNNTFTESAALYGLDVSGFCTQASFFDYDKDGDLDCFIINNSPIPFSALNYGGMRDVDISKWDVDEKLRGGGNHLYQNNKGHYKEVTKAAGLHNGLISFGLGVSVGDINNDGYPDIYVGNDFIEKDYMYINQRNGTFKDELEDRVQKISMSSMSSDLGDINNDGASEIFTTDMIPDDDYRLKTTGTFDNVDLYLSKQKAGLYHQYVRNCLQLNNGKGVFSEIGNYSGVYGTDWSWGALFMDADNDGLNDLYVCNGIAKDVGNLDFLDFFSNDVYAKMMASGQRVDIDELIKNIPVTPLSNRVFKNNGNLQFLDIGKSWGLDKPSFSNSIAYADLDRDGDLDLVVNNENSPAFIYKNNVREQQKNNYIAFQLKGTGENTFAIGSKIKVFINNQIFYRELFPVRGFQSSVDYKQIIGLGKNNTIDSMQIIWPDNTYITIGNPKINMVYHLQQQLINAKQFYTSTSQPSPYFIPVKNIFDSHKEEGYVDFYFERNLPEMLSREGPHVAQADVNGDGLEDIYIGGAKNQEGQLYLQTNTGEFKKNVQKLFTTFRDFEDVAVLFFDADKDGDNDLFIGAGGNNTEKGSREIQHRLYINDGKGNFALNGNAFPINDVNISVAVANDYDNDGDLDLFVGGRSVPYNYGVIPRSYLYSNDGKGNFKDVTEQMNSLLAHVGMVTGAVWANVTGDDKKELIVTGEWMATKVFNFNINKFDEVKNTGLENMIGWWQTITAADINGDGKDDLIVGNIGENFYLRPDVNKPVKLWVADFDHNGTTEQFLTQTINKKDMPVFLKRDVTDQFPFLKKENLKHLDYAPKTIQDLFDKTILNQASVSSFNYCSSIVAICNGRGHFSVKELPVDIQLSSVNAVCVYDVNNDGIMDLITGGNLFTFQPQFGRLDAGYGNVILGNGKGDFSTVSNLKTGLFVKESVKDIIHLKSIKNQFLFTQNNSYPLLYQLKSK